MEKIVKAVEEKKCRMLKTSDNKSWKSKQFVGGYQKDFETGYDDEVFLLFTEKNKICTVYALVQCEKILNMQGDSSNTLFIHSKGSRVRKILNNLPLKNIEFDVAYTPFRHLKELAFGNNTAFNITYSKLLTHLKIVNQEIIYEQTDNYKFSSKIIKGNGS